MTASVIYSGDLRTIATHNASGSSIETDAPIDNKGKGARFSPTDLVAAALASCMLTIVGIAAQSHDFNIDGAQCSVTKIMLSDPRRIGEIIVRFEFPQRQVYSAKTKAIIEHSAKTCPVLESLHPNLKKTIEFLWA